MTINCTNSFEVCSNCVMDVSVSNIQFDSNGVCQFCRAHAVLDEVYPLGEQGEASLEQLVAKIKHSGRKNEYDCVCGVSGGRDSTWTLYQAKQLGLRPLAVHFDNGWNSAIAVSNIKNAINALDVDLVTVVANWENFREVQKAFLRASVPDVEIPTDVAIHKVLHEVAARENIKYILNGHSFRTEGVAPIDWTYMDGRYIKNIIKLFSEKSCRDFQNFSLANYLYYNFIKKIKVIPLLNYFVYEHATVDKVLNEKLGWQYYGGHHHESSYTEFIQSYLLPKKFGIDKRKTELSAHIRSGYITREQACAELENTSYEYNEQLLPFVLNKLAITEQEWAFLYKQPIKSFRDYPSYYPLIKKFKWLIRFSVRLNLVSELLYLKFLEA